MSWLLAAGLQPVQQNLGLCQPPLLGGHVYKLASSESVALGMGVILHFVYDSFLNDAQLSCQWPHRPPRILFDELLEGGHSVVIQGIAPPPVVLPLGAKVLWQTSASDKFVVAYFEAFHRAFGDIVLPSSTLTISVPPALFRLHFPSWLSFPSPFFTHFLPASFYLSCHSLSSITLSLPSHSPSFHTFRSFTPALLSLPPAGALTIRPPLNTSTRQFDPHGLS